MIALLSSSSEPRSGSKPAPNGALVAVVLAPARGRVAVGRVDLATFPPSSLVSVLASEPAPTFAGFNGGGTGVAGET